MGNRRISVVFSMLLVAGIISLSCSSGPQAPAQIVKDTPIIKDISSQDAFTLIQDNRSNPNFVIIDVRTPAEFADGHLSGAINVDINSGKFDAEIGKLVRNKRYLVYCHSGARSRSAMNVMQQLGFREVYNLSAGISQWLDAGLPTEK